MIGGIIISIFFIKNVLTEMEKRENINTNLDSKKTITILSISGIIFHVLLYIFIMTLYYKVYNNKKIRLGMLNEYYMKKYLIGLIGIIILLIYFASGNYKVYGLSETYLYIIMAATPLAIFYAVYNLKYIL